MLLYRDGNFMQVLEGPEDAVRELYETIRGDIRHGGVIRLLERQIDAREFADWSMAFHNLDDPAIREVPGYSEFLNQPLTAETFGPQPDRARLLLEVFRRNLCR